MGDFTFPNFIAKVTWHTALAICKHLNHEPCLQPSPKIPCGTFVLFSISLHWRFKDTPFHERYCI